MNKIKSTYIILWAVLFLVSIMLIVTLPSIWIYYNGFKGISLNDLGVSNEVVSSLIKGINIADSILPKSLGISNVAKIALSYMTAYVPADFPANNLPVKFWGSIVFIVIIFFENLLIVLSTLKKIKTNDDAVFNIPIILQSIAIMLVSIVIALFIVINDKIYYVAAIVIYLLVIALSIIIFFGLDILAFHIKGVDEENAVRTHFIKDMVKNIEALISHTSNNKSVESLRKLNEELRYSVSTSNEKTKDVENRIENVYLEIKQQIEEDENCDITAGVNKMMRLIKERNVINR